MKRSQINGEVNTSMRNRYIIWLFILHLTACSHCQGSKNAVKPPPDKTGAGESEKNNGDTQKMNPAGDSKKVFPPQTAGSFYTADPAELKSQVESYMNSAEQLDELKDRDLLVIVSPHAGYIYSGPVAGWAFAQARGRKYTTAVVLALNHRSRASKAGLLDMDAYATPLGELQIDRNEVKALLEKHGSVFKADEGLFFREHSLEVQLPFVQVAMPGTSIVPVIVATHQMDTLKNIGEALFEQFGDRKDVIFIASTDLSHFHSYDEAMKLDEKNINRILRMEVEKIASESPGNGMCGAGAVISLIEMFRKYPDKGRKINKIKYMNSGDTAGDKSRVVGYGAVAFSLDKGVRTSDSPSGTGQVESGTDSGDFTKEEREELMRIAKETVSAAVEGRKYVPDAPSSEKLKKLGAAFVTLKKGGQLRGCIGHVIARIPLYQTVASVGWAAAVQDYRFSPVKPEELKDLSFEISVLTAPEPVKDVNEIVVGTHGLIMTRGSRSGLLLPQVPVEWKWTRDEFLDHTCRKAGLPYGCWRDPDTKIESFRAIVWGEE